MDKRVPHVEDVIQPGPVLRLDNCAENVEVVITLQLCATCKEDMCGSWRVAVESSEESLMGMDVVASRTEHSLYSLTPAKIFATLQLHGRPVQFQINTGATCNVITGSELPKQAVVDPCTTMIRLYDASYIKPVGTHRARLQNTSRIPSGVFGSSAGTHSPARSESVAGNELDIGTVQEHPEHTANHIPEEDKEHFLL